WRVLFPFAACIAAFLAAPRPGRLARDIYLRRQIPSLEATVQTYRASGQLPETHLGYRVLASHFGDNDVAIEFLWGGGFPVKHTVLIYLSSDDPKPYFHKRGWYYGYRLQNHWWIMQD